MLSILWEGLSGERWLLSLRVTGIFLIMENDAGSLYRKMMSSCDILAQVMVHLEPPSLISKVYFDFRLVPEVPLPL